MKSVVERYRVLRAGDGEDEEGFTLIELLVVLLIIGILLAIAIPTFLSVTKGANNTAAQSNLQTALTASDTWYTQNNQTYTGISLASVDAGISAVSSATASNGPHVVSIAEQNGDTLELTSWSPGTRECWGILDLKANLATAVLGETVTGTYYFVDKSGTQSACDANAFKGAAPSSTTINSTSFPAG